MPLFRIATWNMNSVFRSARADAAWAYLDGLAVDVALVQEARPPAGRANVVWREIGGTRRWGSGVVAFGTTTLRPIPTTRLGEPLRADHIEESHPGAVAIAKALVQGVAPITVISIYGLMYRLANGVSYAVAPLHRMLSDLTPLLDVQRSRTHVVLAGDLNVTPQFPQPDTAAHQAVIDRIRAFGLVDCLGATHRGYVRTMRHANDPESKAWQNDWIFASPSLRLLRCEPIDTDEAWTLSDHCPVVAEFEAT